MYVEYALKFFLFVYNYNTDDGRVEMEKKLTKNPENLNKQRLVENCIAAFFFLPMLIKKSVTLSLDSSNFIKELISLHETQKLG